MTKHTHSFTLEELRQLAHRTSVLKRSVEHMQNRLDQEERISNAALHALGVEREEKNIPRFIELFRRNVLNGERQGFYNEGEPE